MPPLRLCTPVLYLPFVCANQRAKTLVSRVRVLLDLGSSSHIYFMRHFISAVL
jgi:hypothetical protein